MTRDEACALLEWVMDSCKLPIAAQLELMELQGCVRDDDFEEDDPE